MTEGVLFIKKQYFLINSFCKGGDTNHVRKRSYCFTVTFHALSLIYPDTLMYIKSLFKERLSMKKRCKVRSFTAMRVVICLVLCVIISSAYSAESVREMMKKDITDVSSLYTFYTSHTSPYQQRYFLRYLPEYLAKLEITETPSWATTALDAALDSDYAPLAIAAVKSIGDLKLELFSDEMTERFIASEQKAYLSLSYRVAVLESFKKFNDSEKIKSNINRLLLNFPKDRICDPDFTGLMEVTMLFGAASNAPMLAKFETSVDNLLSRQEPDDKRNPDLDRIKELIQRAKRSVAVKGGHDE